MKLPLNYGRLALGLTSLMSLAQSLPTAENLARLAQGDGRTPEELHAKLLHLQHKRLSFDPLTTSIQGKQEISVLRSTTCVYCVYRSDRLQSRWRPRVPGPWFRKW